MERLLCRAQALPALRPLPEALLPALLQHSEPQPERVSPGVVLFHRGERLHCWYLLLGGKVQLYLDYSPSHRPLSLKLLEAGALFGELHTLKGGGGGGIHSCSAKVLQTADFVRIGQRHFMALYNKCADQLQPCIVPMEDLVASAENGPATSRGTTVPWATATMNGKASSGKGEGDEQWRMPLATTTGGRGHRELPKGIREHQHQRTRQHRSRERGDRMPPEQQQQPQQHQLFELSNNISLDDRIARSAPQFRTALSGMDDASISGSELCARLRAACAQWLPDFRQPFSPLLLQGMCQSLLDRLLLADVRTDQPLFRESPSALYRWTVPPEPEQTCSKGQDIPPLSSSLFMLALSATDSLLQHILRKPEDQRSLAELELVFKELSLIRAFSHLSRSMKRGLAKIIRWENREHAGTVIFREGDPGQSWFVVLRGTLEAKAPGKKHSLLHEGDDFGKLALLPNNGSNNNNGRGTPQRQSTVTTVEDGCQLLRVDAAEFNRLLHEVETNTVRLREFFGEDIVDTEDMIATANGKRDEREIDVLVLQRDAVGSGHHRMVAGLPGKILEYTLETRMEMPVPSHLSSSSSHSPSGADSLLQEVLLSLPLWMPSNELCNLLKLYYSFGAVANTSAPQAKIQCLEEWNSWEDSQLADNSPKRRTVAFVVAWQSLLGHRFFLDSVANAFVEELFSCVLEDARAVEAAGHRLEGLEMGQMVRQMEALMALREEAMQRLSRHPRLVLDRGLYSADAPAPEPVLPSDICNQPIRLGIASSSSELPPSHPSTVLRLRMDKSAAEIAQMALSGLCQDCPQQKQQNANGFTSATNGRDEKELADTVPPEKEADFGEELLLVEIRPEGMSQWVHFAGSECSVPTMLSPGGILLATSKLQLGNLALPPEPSLPSARPLCLLISPLRLAQSMTLHHFKLFAATSEHELLVQVVGRDHFKSGWAPANLDLLLRRCHLVQCWASTELLLAPSPPDRLRVLRSLIEMAQHSRQQRDLLAQCAITLGLSVLPISRLHPLWAQLAPPLRRQHSESQLLLSPVRNHRNYRLLAQQLRPPMVPFIPLLLKELSFIHDGRKSRFGDGLVNFEKMHLIAQVLRSFRNAKGIEVGETTDHPLKALIARLEMGQAGTDEPLIRNLHAVEDQRRLMRISQALQPAQTPPPATHHSRRRTRREH